MANYYAACRSNYFKVRDRAAFDAWAKDLPIDVWTPGPSVTGADGDMVGLGATEDGWPSSRYDTETDDATDFDLVEELRAHLADGAVCVLMESGAEKLRYVVGQALAFQREGEIVSIDLQDIYREAQEAFGDSAEITRAEY